MKIYECKYCHKKGTRGDIRKCIKTHIKINKAQRKQIKEARKNSNITLAMLRREI